ETQLPMMRKAVEAKELKTFKTLYAQTLEACNGCHHAAGYGFIHVITPLAPPVTNQQWESGAN
ncbi:MAG TPA: hypothetical protein DGH68_12465, partial [Bacteroidetes bacterium]|nr:hypothetical protein [Bacteroidota bacterium]